VAEEAGLEMVVVCGQNMGDIFRRNSFNLGLHVVQSPEAVADAQDGDVFSFDPRSRRLTNETRNRTYDRSRFRRRRRRSGGVEASLPLGAANSKPRSSPDQPWTGLTNVTPAR
jgi:3-isopropylmalate dehydratase small subunit